MIQFYEIISTKNFEYWKIDLKELINNILLNKILI